MIATITKTSPKKTVHATQLPRIQTHGFVKQFVNAIMKHPDHTHFYDAELIGNIMENVYATTEMYSRYKDVQSNMVSVDYTDEFTLDLMFRMLNIRETVDERMAMEIAGFIQLYLPQRSFIKRPITVNSVDGEGNPVTKVLEVKLYYAYEADAVQWLIKVFFNKSDLINERYRNLHAMTTTYSVLSNSSAYQPVIQTLFFGNDEVANIHNHITFQNEIMTVRFPIEFNIFTVTDMVVGDVTLYACAGIFTMYIDSFASTFTYCS